MAPAMLFLPFVLSLLRDHSYKARGQLALTGISATL
jgi:hypothetical protein